MTEKLTRREVLKYGAAAAGCLLTHGVGHAAEEVKPAGGGADRSAGAPSLPVAIQRCESYDPKLVRARLGAALDQIGGLKKLVENKTVTIKINVTGGPGKLAGLPGERTYHIHPTVLAALCASLSGAGARRIVIVESQYSEKTPEEVLGAAGWDVAGIKSAGEGKVSFIDTRNKGKEKAYATLKVPWGGFMYPAFMVHPCYEQTDVMVSLAKMKDHLSAGITLGAKNMFGITPTSLYGGDAPNEKSLSYRGPVLHNGERDVPAGVPAAVGKLAVKDWKRRVPRVVADLVGARPIDLVVVDGIEANRGGEGPWCNGVEPLQPKLLMVGRNTVCTDAVGTAVMGYDPLGDHFAWPFPGDNHMKLLASVGVGTLDPKKIEVLGLTIEEAKFPFNPKHLPLDYPTAMLYGRERPVWLA